MATQKKSARLIRELKEGAGHQLYASKMAVQNEAIPLLYEMIVYYLEDRFERDEGCVYAAQILYDLNFTMD